MRLQRRRFEALRQLVQFGVDVVQLRGKALGCRRIVFQRQRKIEVGRQVELGKRVERWLAVEGSQLGGDIHRGFVDRSRGGRGNRFADVEIEIGQVHSGLWLGLGQHGLEFGVGVGL
ncbi:hypothetical protein D3C79_651390 [compost metagenome]